MNFHDARRLYGESSLKNTKKKPMNPSMVKVKTIRYKPSTKAKNDTKRIG